LMRSCPGTWIAAALACSSCTHMRHSSARERCLSDCSRACKARLQPAQVAQARHHPRLATCCWVRLALDSFLRLLISCCSAERFQGRDADAVPVCVEVVEGR
jgi:hypothetical protein